MTTALIIRLDNNFALARECMPMDDQTRGLLSMFLENGQDEIACGQYQDVFEFLEELDSDVQDDSNE